MTTWWHWIPHKAATLIHAAVSLTNKQTNKDVVRTCLIPKHKHTSNDWHKKTLPQSLSDIPWCTESVRRGRSNRYGEWWERVMSGTFTGMYTCGDENDIGRLRVRIPRRNWSPCERENRGLVFNAPLAYFTQVCTDERCTVRRRSLRHARKRFALQGS